MSGSRFWAIMVPLLLMIGLCGCAGVGIFAYDEWGEDWYAMQQRKKVQSSLGTPEGWELTGVREVGGTIDNLVASYRISCSERGCRSDEQVHLAQWIFEAGVRNIATADIVTCVENRTPGSGGVCSWTGTRGGFTVTVTSPGWADEPGGSSALTAELTIGDPA